MDLIPVTLLTGFLGSGKTTVLNHLVQQPEMADALVLINEFGEVGLDHLLVAHSQENLVVEMSSGCLCCTIRGDLVKTLKDIHWRFSRDGQRLFRRVVIETTGLADPAPIVHTLITHADMVHRYRLDGMVATIDARNGGTTLDTHVEAVKQAAMADRLFITKSDLVDPAEVGRLLDRLRAINPAVTPILVNQGVVAAQELLDLGLFQSDGKIGDVERWLNEERYRDEEEREGDGHGHAHGDHHEHGHKHGHASGHDHDHQGHHHDVNRHDDQIRAFSFVVDDPIPADVLTTWLDVLTALLGQDMLRIKGILNVEGESRPIVIHGVQHVLHPVVQLDAWPSDDHRTRIVFITRAIERRVIANTFALFNMTDAATQAHPW